MLRKDRLHQIISKLDDASMCDGDRVVVYDMLKDVFNDKPFWEPLVASDYIEISCERHRRSMRVQLHKFPPDVIAMLESVWLHAPYQAGRRVAIPDIADCDEMMSHILMTNKVAIDHVRQFVSRVCGSIRNIDGVRMHQRTTLCSIVKLFVVHSMLFGVGAHGADSISDSFLECICTECKEANDSNRAFDGDAEMIGSILRESDHAILDHIEDLTTPLFEAACKITPFESLTARLVRMECKHRKCLILVEKLGHALAFVTNAANSFYGAWSQWEVEEHGADLAPGPPKIVVQLVTPSLVEFWK